MDSSSLHPQIDYAAAAERQAEIAKVMARMELQKQCLGRLLGSGVLTQDELAAARKLNASTNPILAQHWSEFMDLDASSQQAVLLETRHRGMHWQSLMQCNPYVLSNAWRQAA